MNFTVYGRYLYAIGRNCRGCALLGDQGEPVTHGRVRHLRGALGDCRRGIVDRASLHREVTAGERGLMFEMWADRGGGPRRLQPAGRRRRVIGVIHRRGSHQSNLYNGIT